ncbi:hypothetical protein [Parasitella parasitica]|uniref:Zinc-binding domain-containing protein n=1 Tax=Parasitella parasitica TaxID=35722 RepID=A0A0B7NG38_9FUNG|nr:hypothetical protein [Parasitella parasitica]
MSFYSDTHYKKAPFHVRIVKFGCENCGRRWQSANGSTKDYQKCKNCYEKCYPRSYKIQAPNKRGNENRGSFRAHNVKLCGRCDRLGYSCMEVGNNADEDTVIVNGSNDEEIVLTNANDLSSFIVENKKTRKTQANNKFYKTNQTSIITSMVLNKQEHKNKKIESNEQSSTRDVENLIVSLNINEKTNNDNKNDFALMENYLNDEEKMFNKNFIECTKDKSDSVAY